MKKIRKYPVYANRFQIGDCVVFASGYGGINAIFYNLTDFCIYYSVFNEVNDQVLLVRDCDCELMEDVIINGYRKSV